MVGRTDTGDSAGPGTAGPPDSRRWLILGVIALAQLMVVLDATIVNIALPSAQTALHFSTADRQWVVTAYALSFGSLLLLGGKLSDLLGRKVTFLTGLIGFAAVSAVGGAAQNFTMLVTARACQGVFAALLSPAALSLLTVTFTDAKERGRAFGVYGAVAGAGGAVGLLLGGLLTEYLSWRWCLYVNLIFAGFAVTGAVLLLKRHPAQGKTRIDLPGALLVSGSMFGIVYGFSNAAEHGWHATATWAFIAAGLVLLAGFAWWQARAADPLLPPRIVLNRNRAGAYATMLTTGAGMFGIFLFLTYYLQQTLGFSPVRTGLAFLPMVACMVLLAQICNIALMPRIGPRPLVIVGMLLAAGGLALLTRVGIHSTYAGTVLPSLLVTGVGLGAVVGPVINTGTFGVRPADAGVASATVTTGQQIGGSLGTSLLNSLFASATAAYITAHARPATLVHGRPSAQLSELATLHGYTVAFWWSAAIFAAGAVIGGTLMRWGPLTSRPRTQSAPSAPAPTGQGART